MASEASSPVEPEDGSGSDDEEPQSYGPLELRRYRKEDGRKLILYARADPPDEGQE
jgi:hypothetical protein